MAGKIKGITVEIGGDTTKLDKALASSNAQSKALTNELKEVNRMLKFDPENVDLLTQKQRILSEQIDTTSDKLKLLKEAQAQVQAQFENGEIGADQYREFQREIISTESRLNALQSTLGTVTSDLERLGSGADSAASDMNEAQGEADQLGQSLDEAGDAADNGGDGFTIMKGALADLTANAIQGAISAVGNLVGSFLELSEATEEYRSMQAKVAGSAESFGYSVDFANSKYQEFYKYLGDDQMSTNAITNLMGMKVSTETVSDAANAAIAVWSAYGDSIPIEGLTESINESAQVAAVTGSLADTINWAARSNEDWSAAMNGHSDAQAAFNAAIAEGETQEDAYSAALAACADTQERADLIAQTLNQTYGKSKETYDEMSGGILEANEAELELKDTQAELGKAVEPVNTAISNLKSQALEAILPVVQDVSNAFLDMLQWMKEHPAAAKVLTAVVMSLAAAFGVLATALGIQALIKGVTKAFKLLGVTLSVNPFVLILAGIAALVAGFMTLWKNSESFRKFWINLWNDIKKNVGKVIAELVKFFTVTIPDAIDDMVSWFKKLPGNIKNVLNSVWTSVTKWVSDMVAKALELGKKFLNNVVTYFSPLPGKIASFVSNIWNNVKSWAANMVAKALELGQKFLNNIVNFFKQLPERIGYFIGFALGKVVSWVAQMVQKAIELGSKFLNNIVNFFIQLPGRIYDFITSAYNNVTTWTSNMISKAIETGSSFLSNVMDFIQQLPGQLADWLSWALNNAISWGTDLATTGWEKASEFVSNAIDAITSLPGQIADWLSWALDNAISWGSNLASTGWEKASEFVSNAIDAISNLPGEIADWLSWALSNVVSWGSDLISNGVQAASDMASGIVDAIAGIPGEMVSIGSQIVDGIWDGITGAGSWIWSSISDFASGIVNGFKDALGIRSPSRVFADAAKWIPAGVGTGIAKNADKALEPMQELEKDLISSAEDLNGLTLERKLTTTFAEPKTVNNPVADLVALVSDYFPKLIEASKHAIVLDTGTLVGETVGLTDERLSQIYAMKERGII